MVSKTGVSETSVSETSVSQSSVSQSGVSKTISSSVVGISISLPLGDMDGSSRVSNITSSSSVKSSDSRDSSRGQASDVYRGRGRDTGISSSMVDTISKSSVSQTSVSKTSIPKTVSSSVIRISLPLGNMNGSSRVGDITSSSSVKSSDSRDSSRGQASDVHRCRGRDTGISSSMVSQDAISKSGVSETGVSETSISKTISSSVVRISLPL